MFYDLYMLSLVIPLSIVLLIWLWVTTLQNKKDIEYLKRKIDSLSFRGFGQNATQKPAHDWETDVEEQPFTPPTPPKETFTPPPPQTAYAPPPPQNAYVPPSVSYQPQPYSPYPYAPYAYAPYKARKEKKDSRGDMESWLGRKVIGVLASLLVFIGLIFLGVLAYEHITETVKIISMYVTSAAISGLGIWLTNKKRNNFTLALLGCGCGSFFISILLTHIYFNKINDITAFSLLLVWMAATLLLSKKYDSIQLSVVAHIGMAVSICFAFGLGLTDGKLGILLIYQAAAIAVILLGNIFCYRRTYNFGVFISLALTIVTSAFMWGRFTSYNAAEIAEYPFTTGLSTAFVAGVFIAQFIGGSFLSYLLSVSTTRLKNSDGQIAIHFANKILWVISLFMNVYYMVLRVAGAEGMNQMGEYGFNAVLTAVLITLAAILIHAGLTIVLSLKYNFSGMLETISILLLSGVASILMIILWSANPGIEVNGFLPRISWLFLISLLLILAKHITENKAYSIGAACIIGIDALFMFESGYRVLNDLGSILLPLVYLAFYNFIIWLQWYLLDSCGRVSFNKPARLACFFLTEFSLVSVFATSSLTYKTEILLITLTVLNILLYFIRFDRENDNSSVMRWVFGANEFVLLSVVSGFIAYAHKDQTSWVLYMILSALAFGLAFMRIRKVLEGSSDIVENIWTGIKLTVLVLAVIRGNTGWFEQAYIFSVVCMLTALLCIILGFIGKAKMLRYYGLALTMMCILKLVTYDVTNLNTLLRVLAFIGGGVICFIISAIYNYTSKRLAANEDKAAAVD